MYLLFVVHMMIEVPVIHMNGDCIFYFFRKMNLKQVNKR